MWSRYYTVAHRHTDTPMHRSHDYFEQIIFRFSPAKCMCIAQPHDATERKHEPHANQLENWMHESKPKKKRSSDPSTIWTRHGCGCAVTAIFCFFFSCESNSLSTNFQFKFCRKINWFLIKGNPIAIESYVDNVNSTNPLSLSLSGHFNLRLSFFTCR